MLSVLFAGLGVAWITAVPAALIVTALESGSTLVWSLFAGLAVFRSPGPGCASSLAFSCPRADLISIVRSRDGLRTAIVRDSHIYRPVLTGR